MIVGSIKENTTLEKRVSITPESAKNIIGLGLKVCVEKGYALHLGINDSEYNIVLQAYSPAHTRIYAYLSQSPLLLHQAWSCVSIMQIHNTMLYDYLGLRGVINLPYLLWLQGSPCLISI